MKNGKSPENDGLRLNKSVFTTLHLLIRPSYQKVKREKCDGRLTLQKCWEALQSMTNGKSPENDGLTKEFYVCFSEDPAPPFLKSLKYAFTVGELSTSQKQAVITLTEKEGRDKRLVKN